MNMSVMTADTSRGLLNRGFPTTRHSDRLSVLPAFTDQLPVEHRWAWRCGRCLITHTSHLLHGGDLFFANDTFPPVSSITIRGAASPRRSCQEESLA